jgi:hypothetical protein
MAKTTSLFEKRASMLATSPFEKGGQGEFALQIVDGATLMQRLIRILTGRFLQFLIDRYQ